MIIKKLLYNIFMNSGEQIPYLGVVNAGGIGSRAPKNMAPAGTKGEALKALFSVGEPPITLIEHHVNYHLDSGATSVVASVGPHQKVANYIASRYASNDRVQSFQVERALGIGGDLLRLMRRGEIAEYAGSLVVITNVDTIADINIQDLLKSHIKNGAELSIALSTLHGVPHEGQYLVGDNDRVVYCGECPEGAKVNPSASVGIDGFPLWSRQGSSTGAVVANTELLISYPWSPEDGPLSLYSDMVGQVLSRGQVAAYDNEDRYFTDLGTNESWQRAQEPGLLQPYLHYSSSIS